MNLLAVAASIPQEQQSCGEGKRPDRSQPPYGTSNKKGSFLLWEVPPPLA